MKTKSTLLTFALAAAGLVASREQGYCPIVGYLNVALTNGYNFVANTLDNSPNTLTNVLLGSGLPVPDGTAVFLWDVTNQAFLPPSVFSATDNNWSINYDVSPGKGFVIQADAPWINTFVGTVLQGTNTTLVPGNGKWSLLASPFPIAGGAPLSTTNAPPFPAVDGDSVFVFDIASQSYPDHPVTFFNGFGWYDSAHAANTDGPVLNVAQPFFIQNLGPDTNWAQVLNLEGNIVARNQMAAKGSALPDIRRLAFKSGWVTLEILNPGGGPYNVQFSSDGLVWTTVAVNQTGATWTGPSPGGAQGYYQVTKP